jgi:hypothetical protein
MLGSPWFDRCIMLLITTNTLLFIVMPAASKWQAWALKELQLNGTTLGGCGPEEPWELGRNGRLGYWDELREFERQDG